MTEDKYQEWLQFLFDRPETERGWYWDTEYKDFQASNEEIVILLGKTFLNAGQDLQKYSDRQVHEGLNYIFENAISDIIYTICQKGVSEDLRIEAVLNLKHLYRDCFAERCAPVLGHLNEPGAKPLNYMCYMLWDISPLSSWKDVVLEVMEDALYIPNNACIEGALHGLGHRIRQDGEKAVQIIDRFLSKTKILRPELRNYAQHARTGYIL